MPRRAILFLCFNKLNALPELLGILLELDFALDTLLVLAGIANLSGLFVLEHYKPIL